MIRSHLSVIAIVFTFLAISSCKKQQLAPIVESDDFFVFGHFYGFCMGEECVEIFKLQDEKIYEDTIDSYPLTGQPEVIYQGAYIELDPEKYDIAAGLPSAFPDQLKGVKSGSVIGMPDAGDWGGYYVAIGKQGLEPTDVQFWYIDTQKSNVPEYLHDFLDEIGRTIKEINR